MVNFQPPLPGLARDFNDLTQQEKDFIAYFSAIDMESLSPVVDCYAGIGPRRYGVFLVLARIIKVKERILRPQLAML
jgi:protein tyrosine phosphatase